MIPPLPAVFSKLDGLTRFLAPLSRHLSSVVFVLVSWLRGELANPYRHVG